MPAASVVLVGLDEIVTADTVTVAVAVFDVSAELVAFTVTVCATVVVAGAVYRPLVEMLPTDGLIDHVTAVFVDPATVAVNCCVLLAASVDVAGLNEIVTAGCSVTVAVAVFDVSAELVAFTVTVCVDVIVAGAVYRPLVEMLPTDGLIDHVAAVFVDPATVAVNCCVLVAASVDVVGLNEIVTAGCSVTVAVAVFEVSAELVAFTVTVCVDVIVAGAVYRPLVEMLPTDGLIDHVAAVFVDPATVAVNCCVLVAASVDVAGLSEIVTPGCSVTLAVAVFVTSAELAAFTVTVCADVIVAGAVYRPLVEMLPTNGLIDHVTALFVDPPTVAVNCCVLPAASVDVAGLSETCTGTNVTEALLDNWGPVIVVTVTVTTVADGISEGALYSPLLEIVPVVEFPPATPLTDHPTSWTFVPVTVEEN